MATIRKRGTKWQAQVRCLGIAPITRSFLQRTDAITWARLVEADADRRGLPGNQKALDKTTLTEVLVRFRDTVVARRRSCDVEAIILNAILRQPFARQPLSSLNTSHFGEYRDLRLKTVKPVTINRELWLMQHALDVAAREWAIPLRGNPLKDLRKPKAGPGRDRRLKATTPTDSEWLRLMNACTACRNTMIKPLVELAAATAMRQGELLRLKWSDVNWAARTLVIPETKNGEPRTIPLSASALRLLERLQSEASIPELRVFPTTARAVKQAWRRATKRAGIVDLNFHDLRHEAISRFFELGLSLPEVALISGHKDPRMLMRYTHMRPADVAAKLGNLESL